MQFGLATTYARVPYLLQAEQSCSSQAPHLLHFALFEFAVLAVPLCFLLVVTPLVPRPVVAQITGRQAAKLQKGSEGGQVGATVAQHLSLDTPSSRRICGPHILRVHAAFNL